MFPTEHDLHDGWHSYNSSDGDQRRIKRRQLHKGSNPQKGGAGTRGEMPLGYTSIPPFRRYPTSYSTTWVGSETNPLETANTDGVYPVPIHFKLRSQHLSYEIWLVKVIGSAKSSDAWIAACLLRLILLRRETMGRGQGSGIFNGYDLTH